MKVIKWFEADKTWAILGYPTLEAYVSYWVPEQRFHGHVPEDIHKAYRTTGYILANAWHHYPMYDQGLQHLLGIMEMSVKFRAEQLGIGLGSSQQENSQPPKLANLIDQVCRRTQAKDLKQKLHWARKIRNYHAHPERYSFAPVAIRQAVIPLLNLLNELFIDATLALQAEQYLNWLTQLGNVLRGKLLILKYQGLRYLMHQAEPLRAFHSTEQWRSIWAFHPVLPQAQQALSQHRYLLPIVLCFSNVEKLTGGLQARNMATGEIVRMLVNEDPRNQAVWSAHQQAWRQAKRINQWLYSSSQRSDVLGAQHKLEHEFGWGYAYTDLLHR